MPYHHIIPAVLNMYNLHGICYDLHSNLEVNLKHRYLLLVRKACLKEILFIIYAYVMYMMCTKLFTKRSWQKCLYNTVKYVALCKVRQQIDLTWRIVTNQNYFFWNNKPTCTAACGFFSSFLPTPINSSYYTKSP